MGFQMQGAFHDVIGTARMTLGASGFPMEWRAGACRRERARLEPAEVSRWQLVVTAPRQHRAWPRGSATPQGKGCLGVLAGSCCMQQGPGKLQLHVQLC